MLMITPSMDVKSTLSPIVQKSLAITQLFLQQLCALCVYGIGFLYPFNLKVLSVHLEKYL